MTFPFCHSFLHAADHRLSLLPGLTYALGKHLLLYAIHSLSLSLSLFLFLSLPPFCLLFLCTPERYVSANHNLSLSLESNTNQQPDRKVCSVTRTPLLNNWQENLDREDTFIHTLMYQERERDYQHFSST